MYHSPARIVDCVSEFWFLISKNNKQTKQEKKKAKETKEEKRISLKNELKKINFRLPG